METLKDRQTSLQSEITTGQQLMESEDAPAFVSEAVSALINTASETTQLANFKYESLKVIQKRFIAIVVQKTKTCPSVR